MYGATSEDGRCRDGSLPGSRSHLSSAGWWIEMTWCTIKSLWLSSVDTGTNRWLLPFHLGANVSVQSRSFDLVEEHQEGSPSAARAREGITYWQEERVRRRYPPTPCLEVEQILEGDDHQPAPAAIHTGGSSILWSAKILPMHLDCSQYSASKGKLFKGQESP